MSLLERKMKLVMAAHHTPSPNSNQYGYRNRGNRHFYSNQNRNYNNRPRRQTNSFFNRNFMQQQPYFNNVNYNNDDMMISRPFLPNRRFNQNRQYNRNWQFNQNRPRSHSNGSTPTPRRSRSRQRRSPRPLRLNDFMPSEFRDNSPNAQYLASNFNLATTTTDVTPADALPQRQRFAPTAASSTDTTQPFAISDQGDGANQQQQQRTNNGQRQRTTTAAHRRRQRRNHQQQYQQQSQADDNPNRFVALAEEDTSNQIDTETTINDRPATNIMDTNKRIDKKKKIRLYLQKNRIVKWFEDNSKSSISGRGNQAYVLATTPIYDEWGRNNYEFK
ncbi:unnamed protein product, partial [Adineta ricciae]